MVATLLFKIIFIKAHLDPSARERTSFPVPVLDEQGILVQHQLDYLAAP